MGLLLASQQQSKLPAMQQALINAGIDSGAALNMAAAMQMQADPTLGARVAQWLQQHYPQKKPSNHLGGGR